jgi:hypothetical protein
VLRRIVIDEHVRQFVVMIQLAAETHGEALRTALGYVYDTSAVEQRMEQIALVCNHAELKLAELCAMKSWLEIDAGPAIEDALRLRGDVETIDKRLTALESKVNKALDYLREVVVRLQRSGALTTKGPTGAGATNGRVQGPTAGQPRAGETR